MIESINNERVKYWSKLKDRKYQNIENLFLVEGEHLVEEASKNNLLEEVIALEGCTFDYENITYVKEQVMKKMTSLTNIPRIIGVVHKLKRNPIKGNVLALDAIQNPGNMGTIIRSAVAFGIDTIIIGTGSVNVYNPKVIRASEGMLFNINIIEEDLEIALPKLKQEGYTIYSTDVSGGHELSGISFSDKSAIIIGNEGAGVSTKIKDFCDDYIYIEMDKSCESLNASIATSIILYKIYRQK